MISTAMLLMCIAVPYWAVADARGDARRNCVNRALNGQEIAATALAGVEHAEDTAHLMDSITEIIEAANPTSPAVLAIRSEVDRYTLSVARFRVVAERYTPTTFADCGIDEPPPYGGLLDD